MENRSVSITAILIVLNSLGCETTEAADRPAPPVLNGIGSPQRLIPHISFADEDTLLLLWKSTVQRSPKLQQEYSKDSTTNAPDQKLMLADFQNVLELRLEHPLSANGAALTIPNLEPTYPRYGQQVPGYELPIMARHGHSGLSGASIGSSIGAIGTLRSKRSAGSAVVDDLITKFLLYKESFIRYEKAKRAQPTTAVQSRNVEELEKSRAALIELTGPECMTQLDLHLRTQL